MSINSDNLSSSDSSHTDRGFGRDPEHLDSSREQEKPDSSEFVEGDAITKTVHNGQGNMGHFVNTTLGDFELLREIGRGGMGVVYEARQISLNKRVAVKILPFAGVLDQRVIKRFKNEAWAAAQLTHRNIVPVYHVGSERGIHFYAMQYIDGGDLGDLYVALREAAVRGSTDKENRAVAPTRPTRRVVRRGGDARVVRSDVDADAPTEATSTSSAPVAKDDSSHRSGWSKKDTLASPQLVNLIARNGTTSVPVFVAAFVRMGIQVADALHYAHEMGIVHRDIKPSNLLLDIDGEVWVADFGLAQIQSDPGMTATDAIVGTLRYMSPEQAMGKRVGVDHRADVYSLGATLYELMTLQRAFSGKTREEVLRKITFEDPVSPRKIDRRIPVELETIVMKALSKNPDHRYQTAGEMAEDLRLFQNDQPIKGRKPTVPQRVAKWANRHRPLVASAAGMSIITFIASIIIAIVLWHSNAATEIALESEKEQRAEVERLLQRSEGLRLAANSTLQLDADPTRALLLAMEGAKQYPGIETNNAILQARDNLRERHTLTGHDVFVGNVVFNEDGTKLISTPQAGRVSAGPHAAMIWDAASGALLGELKDEVTIASAAFSPDRFRILTTSAPSRVKDNDQQNEDRSPSMWDGTRFRKLDVTFKDAFLLDAHPALFNPDGSSVVLPSKENTATIYDCIAGHARVELVGHEKRVVFAAFSPNGDQIATASDDNTVRVWDATSGKKIYEFPLWRDRDPEAEECLIDSVAFRSDGRQLATGSRAYGVHLWDLTNGERVNETHIPGEIATYWPSGMQLVSHRKNIANLTTCEVLTGKPLRTLRHESVLLRHVVISPDGRWIATNGHSNTRVVYLWNVALGKIETVLRGHEASINAIAFTPDSTMIATGASDKTVRLWDIQAGRERETFPTSNWPSNTVTAISPNGMRFAVADRNPVMSSHLLKKALPDQTTSIAGRVWMPRDSSQRLVSSRDNSLSLRSLVDGSEIKSISGSYGSFGEVALSPQGNRVAAIDGRDLITLWFPDEDRQIGIPLQNTKIYRLTFSPDGKMFVAASADGFARIWDSDTGLPIADLQNDGKVLDVVFDSSGNRIAAVTDQNRANIWNLESQSITSTFWSPGESFSSVEFSFDDAHLISYEVTTDSKRVIAWDVSTGEIKSKIDVTGEVHIATHPKHREILITSTVDGAMVWDYETETAERFTESPMIHGSYSRDGSQIVIASATGVISNAWQPFGATGDYPASVVERWNRDGLTRENSTAITAGRIFELFLSDQGDAYVNTLERFGVVTYDLASYEQIGRVAGHAAPVSACAFTADTKRLITASWDGSVVVWTVADGQQQMRLTDHKAPVYAVAKTADDRYLLTGAADGECILWNLKSGQLAKRFQVAKSAIERVVFNPTENLVLVITKDKSMVLFDLRTDQELELDLPVEHVEYAEFGPDGSSLIVVPQANDLAKEKGNSERLVNQELLVVPVNGQPSKAISFDGMITTAHFDSDGKKILVATDNGSVTTLDVRSGQRESLFVANHLLKGAAFDSTGEYVAVMGAEMMTIWNVKDRMNWLSVPCEYAIGSQAMHHVDPFVPNSQRIIARRIDTGEYRTWPLLPLEAATSETPRPLTTKESTRYLSTGSP